MNSGSYSAFHSELYQLVACHLPTIRIELYVVFWVFAIIQILVAIFLKQESIPAKQNHVHNQYLSPTQFKTQARQCAIQKDVQNHRLVLHQSHSQV
jgi:hypothetical protein